LGHLILGEEYSGNMAEWFEELLLIILYLALLCHLILG
jgi:hypothetical protein